MKLQPLKDYYKILNLPASAAKEEIKKGYRHLAKCHHPDRHSGNPEKEKLFKEINEAYSILIDPVKRRNYDLLRSLGNTSDQRPRPPGWGSYRANGHPMRFVDPEEPYEVRFSSRKEAQERFKERFRVNRDARAEGHYQLGFLYQQIGLFDSAVEEYREAIRIGPEYAKAHFGIGQVYDALNEGEKALRHMQLAEEYFEKALDRRRKANSQAHLKRLRKKYDDPIREKV